jgi:hypothetical protein
MNASKVSLIFLFALTVGLVAAPPHDHLPPHSPPVESMPFYKDAEIKFAEFFKPKIKTTTDSTVSFEGTALGEQWLGFTEIKHFSVAIVCEWLFPRFTIIVPDPLTKADELNGIEFRGIAAILADAVRLTPAKDVPAEALAAATRRNPNLNGQWHPPESDGFVAKYSVQRRNGTWEIEPYRGRWNSAWKFPRENWLCAKPRPPAPIVDQNALQAEARKAFEKCKRSPTADGFTLLFLGDDMVTKEPVGLFRKDSTKIREHLIEYRGTGEPQFDTAEVSAAERQNGIEHRFDLRIRGGAYQYKEIKVRARRSDEAVPRTYCHVGPVKITGEWKENKLWMLHAEKDRGTWHFTDLYGELIQAD